MCSLAHRMWLSFGDIWTAITGQPQVLDPRSFQFSYSPVQSIYIQGKHGNNHL